MISKAVQKPASTPTSAKTAPPPAGETVETVMPDAVEEPKNE